MPALAPSEQAWYQVRLAEQERRRKKEEAETNMQEIFKELEDHNAGLDSAVDVKPDELILPVIGTTQESTAPDYHDRESYIPSAQTALQNAINHHFRNALDSQRIKRALDTEVPTMMAKKQQGNQANRISEEESQQHTDGKPSGMAKTPDAKSEDDESGILSSLFWLMDRPQQSVFQAARAGADAFERDLHEGSNPLAAAARSVPSLVRGAAQGLFGTKPNVYGEQLTEGFTEHWTGGEPNRSVDHALANFINFTASPVDVVAPVGKMLKIPWATYKNMARAAPEFRAAWKGLGGPLKNLAKRLRGKALPAGDWRLDWLGRYGVHSSAPRHVDDIQPWIVQTKAPEVQGLRHRLLGITPNPRKVVKGSFIKYWNRASEASKPKVKNLILQSLKDPSTLYHEGGHFIADLLDVTQTNQLPEKTLHAAEMVSRRLPANKARIAAGRYAPYLTKKTRYRTTDHIRNLHSEVPYITQYLKGRGYTDLTKDELGHEIIAHWIQNHFHPSQMGQSTDMLREVERLDNDTILNAIKDATYSEPFLPSQVKDLSKLERAPTHIAAQAERTIRHIMRKQREQQDKMREKP
jgi:hypothetical protein